VQHSIERVDIAAPSLGTVQALVVHRYGTTGARPKVYIQAAIHAGEIPALLVAHHLQALLETAKVLGEVVLVPAANPIGLAQRIQRRHVGRYDLDSGVNFNRGFPDLAGRVDVLVGAKLGDDPVRNVAMIREAARLSLNEMPAVQPSPVLKKALLGLALDADIVLDLHCAKRALLHLFVNASSWPDAADLHADIGSEATFLEEETGSGLAFDHATGGLWRELAKRHPGRPIPEAAFSATVELRGFAAVDDRTAAVDAANLMRFLQRRGVVAGDAGPLPEPLSDPTPLAGVGFVMAPRAGVVVLKTELGAHVRRGQIVADIVDPMAETVAGARTSLISPTDGLVYELLDQHYVIEGQSVCHVAGLEPLADQRDNLLLD
jgi:hypothetical protein